MLRRLVVLHQDIPQRVLARSGKLLLAWVAAHTDRTCVGANPAKRVASGPPGKLFVQAIAKSWHDGPTFG